MEFREQTGSTVTGARVFTYWAVVIDGTEVWSAPAGLSKAEAIQRFRAELRAL